MEKADEKKDSRRRIERISLSIPVRVDCKISEKDSWSEITKFISISSFGAGFNISHKVLEGQLLLLTTSFPSKLRCYDYSEIQYKIWTIVRHCNTSESDQPQQKPFKVGVAFIGKNPPVSFINNPQKRYILGGFTKNGLGEVREFDSAALVTEQTIEFVSRSEERYQIPYEVIIEVLDENQKTIDQEFTVTENVSPSGCAIKSILESNVGRLVRVNILETNNSLLAIVRNKRTGNDGTPRLHLEFLGDKFPIPGI